MALRVSLVMPAYDEALRLSPYLLSIRDHFLRLELAHEVIVVDDGSQDGTRSAVAALALDWTELCVVRHDSNLGKGRALCTGVTSARGDYILLADADGATPIEEEAKLREALLDGADIAIGSRMLWGRHSCLPGENGRQECLPHVERSWPRNMTGAAFAWAVRTMFGLPFRDTQCGFKMFRREVAQRLFALCKEDGYLIDVEVLLHAHRLGYKIVEVPVAWRDVPGSKVRLFRDGWRMLTGLWRLRRRLGRRVDPQISQIAQIEPRISDALRELKSAKSA